MAVLLDLYAPYDSGPGANVTESMWRNFMGKAVPDGVIAGVLGSMVPFGDSSGMWTKVNSGEIWIQGEWGRSQNIKTIPHGPSDPSHDRLDRIVCRNDFVNNNMKFDVLTGIPGVSPVLPSLTQNTSIWEIGIGQTLVTAGSTGITAANVTDMRTVGVGARQFTVMGTLNFATSASLAWSSGASPNFGVLSSSVADPGFPYKIRVSGMVGGSLMAGQIILQAKLDNNVSGPAMCTNFATTNSSSGTWTGVLSPISTNVLTGSHSIWINLVLQASGQSALLSAAANAMYLCCDVIPS